jgi:hypothetical protein
MSNNESLCKTLKQKETALLKQSLFIYTAQSVLFHSFNDGT